MIIDFKHLGRNHDRLAGTPRGPDDLFLQARYFFQRHLDAQIAARHHQRIGEFQDFRETVDRLGLFDLGEDTDAAARDLADFRQIVGPLNEGKRDPVDIGVERRNQVLVVFLRQRTDRNFSVGDADALAVGELATNLDGAFSAGMGRRLDDEADLAVVQKKAVAGLQRFQDFAVRQVHARLVAGRCIGIEVESGADFQLHRAIGECADAQFRALQVGENANGAADTFFHVANTLDQGAQKRVIGVAHVDAEYVGAGAIELFDCLHVRR